MKNILNKFFKKPTDDKDIGMAVQEQKTSGHREDFAVAQSTKDRLVDKIRGNMVYILIALALIIPGIFKLIGFFNEGNTPASKQVAALTFNEETNEENPNPQDSLETLLAQQQGLRVPPTSGGFPEAVPPEQPIVTTPIPEAVPAEEPIQTAPVSEFAPVQEPVITTPVPEATPSEEPIITTPVPEAVPPEHAQGTEKEENAARSMLANLKSIGGGSAEKKANINAAEAPIIETVASPPAPISAEEILKNYAQEENKIQQQLAALLSRMDKLEEGLATVDSIEKRILAIENNNQIAADEQFKIVQTKLAQLEKNLTAMGQQAGAVNQATLKPAVPARANPENAEITVEAVVPGRAWIRNPDGVLMVVQVGNTVEGVGKITRIDARDGTVATATHVYGM